jgi:hypothetical protein
LFSGSYTDLTNKPTIPSDINQLTDDDGLLNSGSGSGASSWSDISFDGGSNFESMGSDPDNYGSSELVIDAGEFVFSGNYTPGDATSWASPAPTTIDQALDRLAAKIAYLSDQGYTQKP